MLGAAATPCSAWPSEALAAGQGFGGLGLGGVSRSFAPLPRPQNQTLLVGVWVLGGGGAPRAALAAG